MCREIFFMFSYKLILEGKNSIYHNNGNNKNDEILI